MSSGRSGRFAALVAFLILALVPCSAAIGEEKPSTWRQGVNGVLSRAEYRHAHWGLLVCDAVTGEVLFEQDADKLFAPASVTKLFSVAAAWETFGPDHRFVTPVFRRGELKDGGRLEGDLVLRSACDFTLGGRTNARGEIAFRNTDHTYANGSDKAQLTEEDPLAGLNALARQVVASGVHQVTGEVLIDCRLFDAATSTGSGPENITAVLVNDNVLDVQITPTSVGQPAMIFQRPQTTLLEVDAIVETSPADIPPAIRIDWAGPGRAVVRGTVPLRHAPLVRVLEWSDAEFMARGLFIEALRREGVDVAASPLAAAGGSGLPDPDWYDSAVKVAQLESPPFAEHAKLILKVSHNLHASTLPLLMAATNGKRTLADGLKIEGDLLARLGVDRNTISFGGGAGGDRADYVTPRATVQLLKSMAGRSDFDRFRATLPILGVDGTLAAVVGSDSPARGKVFAKTGTLYWDNVLNARTLLTSKALAGYIDTQSGRRLIFTFFVNLAHLPSPNDTVREGKALGRLAEIFQQAF
jgi:D-alanyl-D-alanine carboxypeptidase/D-alanyl-D-alanine-endopeptidase (penicillin-binding protein 4)